MTSKNEPDITALLAAHWYGVTKGAWTRMMAVVLCSATVLAIALLAWRSMSPLTFPLALQQKTHDSPVLVCIAAFICLTLIVDYFGGFSRPSSSPVPDEILMRLSTTPVFKNQAFNKLRCHLQRQGFLTHFQVDCFLAENCQAEQTQAMLNRPGCRAMLSVTLSD
jgi:hypothetical protein